MMHKNRENEELYMQTINDYLNVSVVMNKDKPFVLSYFQITIKTMEKSDFKLYPHDWFDWVRNLLRQSKASPLDMAVLQCVKEFFDQSVTKGEDFRKTVYLNDISATWCTVWTKMHGASFDNSHNYRLVHVCWKGCDMPRGQEKTMRAPGKLNESHANTQKNDKKTYAENAFTFLGQLPFPDAKEHDKVANVLRFMVAQLQVQAFQQQQDLKASIKLSLVPNVNVLLRYTEQHWTPLFWEKEDYQFHTSVDGEDLVFEVLTHAS